MQMPPEVQGEDELHGLKLDWKRFVSEQLQDFCREEIRASSFTGVGRRVFPLPFGLSGCVTTAVTSYPFFTRAARGGTAKSGVPI